MSVDLIGKFGQYEVWAHRWQDGTHYDITDAQGNSIDPGETSDDLLAALMLVAVRRREDS